MATAAVTHAASNSAGMKPTPPRDQRGGGEAADADERELAERELTGPAGEHGERKGDERVQQHATPAVALGRKIAGARTGECDEREETDAERR